MTSVTSTALIGFVAGALTAAAFLPQVIETYRRRSTRGLSLLTCLLMLLGVGGWLLYGVLKRDPVMVATNAAMLCLVTALVAMFAVSRRNDRHGLGHVPSRPSHEYRQ